MPSPSSTTPPAPSPLQLSPRPLTRLFAYLAPHRTRFVLAVLASFVNKVLDLAPPVLVAWCVDTVVRQPPGFIARIAGDDRLHAALLLGVLGALIFALESFFQWLYDRGFKSLAQDVQHELRVDAYRSMQAREMAFFEEHRVGETMAMLGDDVNQLERFLNTVWNDVVQLVSLIIISAVICGLASLELCLWVVLPIPLIIWGSLGFQKLLSPRYRRVREGVGLVNTRLENNLGGITVIKAFTAEDFEAERLAQASAEYRDRNHAAIRLAVLFTPLIRMGVALGFAPVLFVGTLRTLDGSVSPGTFALFAMMVQRILWPLTRLGTILDEVERCRASAARVFGLLDTKPTIVDTPGAVKLERAMGRIAFRGVHFSYGRGLPVLRGLDLDIAPGETVGIAGVTGSGKSTLVKLLLRFYEPTAGRIELDGRPLPELELASLRRQMALVSQDVYVFHGTLRENIAYGNPHANEAAIQEAARRAELHDFIATLPGGYDTIVGERGIKLSGGQRQRLSMARALLKDAPVLILDEATSSVDTETERAIQRHLDEFTRGRTALVIAHRLSTIRGADRIVVLGEGRLAEEGTHDQLVAAGGIYADLWSLQSGEALARH